MLIKKTLVIFLSFIIKTKLSCVHQRMLKERIGKPLYHKKTKKTETHQGRNLSETWHEIKIKIDYSNITNIDQETSNFIQKTVMPLVTKRFKSLLKVKGDSKIPGFTTCTDEIKVPSLYSTPTSNTDLIIFVKLLNEDDSYLAYAGPCKLSNNTSRPTVGLIVINTKHLKTSSPHITRLYETLLHEFCHILAMSPNLYNKYNTSGPKYTKETQKIETTPNKFKKVQVYKMITPKLLAAAKSHFNCDTLTGVYLENEGQSASAGVHFEKAHYGNELMTAQDVGRPAFSKITLSLFEDTGWYKVDFLLADGLVWGRGQGCGFAVDHGCSVAFEEFCAVEGAYGCSRDYLVKTKCTKTVFSDSCLVKDFFHSHVCKNRLFFHHTSYYKGEKSFEEPGEFSRCFETKLGNFNRVGCFKAKCDHSGKVIVTADGSDHDCQNTGQEITVGNLKIICPDASDFCPKLAPDCPSDCSGNGRCLLGKTCLCDYFHFGATCNSNKTCSSQTLCEESTSTSDTNNSINENEGSKQGGNPVPADDSTPNNIPNIDTTQDIMDALKFHPLLLAFNNLFLWIITFYVI